MRRIVILLAFSFLLAAQAQAQNPRVWLDFEQGPVFLSLDMANAPLTSQNFLDYVDSGFYDGIIFHRIIPDFVLQGGGFDKNFFFQPPGSSGIQSERNNGLSNLPGTIAMALAGNNVNSAQTQFFINAANNDFLDENFTVFGQVSFGQSIIDEMEALRTGNRVVSGSNLGDVPMSPPLIRRAVRIQGDGFPVMPQLAGSWFDLTNPGVGFNIEIARNTLSDSGARLVLYWYDYREGQPYWLLGVGEYEYGETTVNLDLISWDGMTGTVDFLSPPPDEGYISVGQVGLRFKDCHSAELDFQIDDISSGSIDISRLTLPEGISCEDF